MGSPIRLALVLDMILVVLGYYTTGLYGWLPIGGNQVAQLGTLLIVAVIVTEIRDSMRPK
jgi:hypothetical protein